MSYRIYMEISLLKEFTLMLIM